MIFKKEIFVLVFCVFVGSVFSVGCGDGSKKATEECDDGNFLADDGCSPTCTIEPGWTCAGSPSVCKRCGDGIIQVGENCDDNNQFSLDGCSSTCLKELGWNCPGIVGGPGGVCSPICGDGNILGNEQCDDGNTINFDGCSSDCKILRGWDCTITNPPYYCYETCGNSIISTNEACDDGNALNGDGCAANCQVSPGFFCQGEPSVCQEGCGDGVKTQSEGCDDGNNLPNDGCSPGCAVESGWNCVSNGVNASLCYETCGNGVKTKTEYCDDGNIIDLDGCNSTCGVESGFICEFSPSQCRKCGNGKVESGELCDDGNLIGSDGCSAICVVEPGYTCLTSSPSTPSVCSICGNGIKEGLEECDDGNIVNEDGCSSQCLIESGWNCIPNSSPSNCSGVCGNGVITSGENCDDGNFIANDGCSLSCHVIPGWYCAPVEPSACSEVCGNFIMTPSEACDDGNLVGGDGCSSNCTTELGFVCQGQTSVCLTVCGDSILKGNETCDDGNSISGDGCSSVCQTETGFNCDSVTNSCSPNCGDGLVVRGEECDDGNQAASDGCFNCQIEASWRCSGEPSTCDFQPDSIVAPGDSNNGSTIAVAVVVPILFIAVVVAVVGFILIRRKHQAKKLRRPNFLAIAFGADGSLQPEVIPTETKEILGKLEELLVRNDFALVSAICDVVQSTEIDKVTKSLCYIFYKNSLSVDLVNHFISVELKISSSEGVLFRANSIASKLFAGFSKLFGLEYVWLTLALIMNELNDIGENSSNKSKYKTDVAMSSLTANSSIEVDPNRMQESDDSVANQLQLQLFVHKVWKAIIDSENNIPTEFREIFSHVSQEIATKYEPAVLSKVIGGFFFLRFICPCITTPHVYGLLQNPPNENTQRSVVLLSKILQNISNGTLPGKKEQYMEGMNEFISSHIKEANEFFSRISNLPSSENRITVEQYQVPEVVTYQSLSFLHKLLGTSINKVNISLDSQANGEEIKEKLKEILQNF